MEKQTLVPVFAVDFDNTVHDAAHPIPGRRMGPPIEGAKEALTGFIKRGEVVIFTVWGDTPKPIEDWFKFYGIPFTRITNIKPSATYYIDDKAIRFTSWPEVLKQIKI